jgi:hypothetical protein
MMLHTTPIQATQGRFLVSEKYVCKRENARPNNANKSVRIMCKCLDENPKFTSEVGFVWELHLLTLNLTLDREYE